MAVYYHDPCWDTAAYRIWAAEENASPLPDHFCKLAIPKYEETIEKLEKIKFFKNYQISALKKSATRFSSKKSDLVKKPGTVTLMKMLKVVNYSRPPHKIGTGPPEF